MRDRETLLDTFRFIQTMNQGHYDVVCIGAGISGLYLGYRMARENPDKSLLILERLKRVGGKITSVPIEGVRYEAEGCPQRFMSSQPVINGLMEEFGLGATSIGFGSYSTSDSDTRDRFLEREPSPSDYKTANLDTITNLPNIQEGSYDNLEQIDALSGYGFGTNLMNTETVITKLGLTAPGVQQYYPDGGFKRLAASLASVVKEKYDIKLGTEVMNVYRLANGLYLIESLDEDSGTTSRYTCKHLVFTGGRRELNMIGGNSKSLRVVKELLYDSIGTDLTYMKLYATVSDPWWNADEVGHVFNSRGPLNQIYYISQNTICAYCDSHNADLLYYLVPERLRATGINNIEWTASGEMPRLNRFMIKYVRDLFDNLVDGPTNRPGEFTLTRIAFKYTKEASLAYGPLSMPQRDLCNLLNDYQGLHLISDSYHTRQGWIEYCLECVDSNYMKIVN